MGMIPRQDASCFTSLVNEALAVGLCKTRDACNAILHFAVQSPHVACWRPPLSEGSSLMGRDAGVQGDLCMNI